jgi:phospho-N-acetylmuramoyl-pentapeptide-transferase
MLYHLLYSLHEQFSALNVFRYITFRTIGSTVTAFMILMMVAPWFIRFMQKLQIGQVIRADGPESHLSKKGVPTMGGVLIIGAMIASTLLWADLTNGLVWLVMGTALFYGIIGSVDDLKKIRKNNSKGLSPRGKLLLQVLST